MEEMMCNKVFKNSQNDTEYLRLYLYPVKRNFVYGE